MKIIVISLATSAARRASAAEQLARIGRDFDFFDAVDGRTAQHDLFNRYRENQFLIHYGRPATPGELGCYASHFLVWQRCVDLAEPLLVLEDDFQLADNFLEAFTLCDRLIDQYGYIRLQRTYKSKARVKEKIGEFSLVKYTKPPQGGLCYALTPGVAQRFISHSRTFEYPLDVFVRHVWIHKVPLFGLLPYVADNGVLAQESTIGARLKVKKHPRVIVRRFAHKLYAQLMTVRENLKYQWSGAR
jgi:glycosyl transferase family 25